MIAPALALLVLAVALWMGGGFGGFLAGSFVGLLALGLLGIALLMTHAPVTIANYLSRTDEKRGAQEGDTGESNGARGDGTGEADK